MPTVRVSLATVAIALFLVSGLTSVLPLASAQSVVVVTIPQGAGVPGAPLGYSPDKITVMIGVNNTVKWINGDNGTETGAAHTVTSVSGNGSLSSGYMAPDASYNYTFTAPGTYRYMCTYHSWMTGTVIVEGASTTPTPEFPAASLAVVLFAAMAAVMIAAPRLRPTPAPQASR